MRTRRERLEAKIEKREEWAAKAAARSQAAFSAVSRIADNIPMGQPILVGHHSERRARRDQDRIHSGMSKGVAEGKLADHHESKAAALARQLDTSIFSDDPDAIEALEERIAEAEAKCAKRAAWNSAWKKGAAAAEKKARAAGKTDAEDLLIARLDGGEEALRASGASPAIVQAANTVMEQGYSWIKSPFDLTSERAAIRRDRERIEQIRKQQATRREAEESEGGIVVRDHGAEWCSVTFAEKPDRETLDALKAAGFRWDGTSWAVKRAALPAFLAPEPPSPPAADIDPALYGLPQDSEIGPSRKEPDAAGEIVPGWDVVEPGPEQVPPHLRGHVAALSPTYWTQLAKLPGDANSGTRANEYETLVALGVAERKVEPIYFDNGQPRGSHLFFRLVEREAHP